MANPQLEDGYTKIVNDILEALARIRIPGEASQIVHFLLRKLYGWNKTGDQISLSQFCEATGLSKVHVCRAIKTLLGMNIITQKGNVTQKGNAVMSTYGFQKDFDKWIPLPKKVTLPKKVKGSTQKGKGGSTQKGKQQNKLYTKETHTKERDASFEIFWKNFPKRNGKKVERQAAWEEYQLLQEEEMEIVNQAALNYANSERVQDGIGICDPVRFLIKGRGEKKYQPWRDWIEPEKPEYPKEDGGLTKWIEQNSPK